MDWAKAKNILIIAFIITNLFLGYYVLNNQEDKNYAYTLREERVDDVKKIIEEKNIIIEADIPQQIEQPPELIVEYETYSREDVEAKFPEFRSWGEDEIKYYSYNEVVEVPFHQKAIRYIKNSKSSISNEIDEKEAREIANEFIGKHGFKGEDVEFWAIEGKDGRFEIEYKQTYQDVILDNGYMTVTIKNGEVIRLEKRWLKPIEIKTSDKKITPVTKALLLAIDELNDQRESEETAVVIKDIMMVYKLDIYTFPELVHTEWYEIDENTGTGTLYWRICLENGECIDKPAEAFE